MLVAWHSLDQIITVMSLYSRLVVLETFSRYLRVTTLTYVWENSMPRLFLPWGGFYTEDIWILRLVIILKFFWYCIFNLNSLDTLFP